MVEADFMREYHIDLPQEIETMTWRRFCVLLNNLSGNSVYVITYQGRKEGNVAIDASDPIVGDRIVDSFFG